MFDYIVKRSFTYYNEDETNDIETEGSLDTVSNDDIKAAKNAKKSINPNKNYKSGDGSTVKGSAVIDSLNQTEENLKAKQVADTAAADQVRQQTSPHS